MDPNQLRERASAVVSQILQTDTARTVLADARVQRAIRTAWVAGHQAKREWSIFRRELTRARALLEAQNQPVVDDLEAMKRELDGIAERRRGP